MNLPGSSPLIPRSRTSREGPRSQSLTDTTQPESRLSNNRSYASLRTEPPSRPKSQNKYPTRLKRPGYRPSSPAYSDAASSQNERSHGPGYHGYSYTPVPPVPPIPAVTPIPVALRNRSQNILPPDRRRQLMGQASSGRHRQPVHPYAPHADMPSVPPLMTQNQYHHAAQERSRKAHKTHKSTKGSFSSGSTSRRGDSDPSSSDAPSPPTPRDGSSMEVLVSPSVTQELADNLTGGCQFYYDYTEQFEFDPVKKLELENEAPDFVRKIKTIIEERSTPEPTPKKAEVVINETAELPGSEVANVAELPASPVARRITRELILAALAPAATEDVDPSNTKPESDGKGETETSKGRLMITNPACDEQKESTPGLPRDSSNRHSILSQADTSVVDSSTLNFAVNYSIPAITGTEIGIGSEKDVVSDTSHGPALNTDDGMSELLEGYQHTESKQSTEPLVDKTDDDNDKAEKKSQHAPKSSDEQSFKSCTAPPEHPAQTRRDADTRSTMSKKGLPDVEAPFKDSDVRSFKTCRDTATPDRDGSLPSSRLPSSNLTTVDSKSKRPVPQMPLTTPSVTGRKIAQYSILDTGSSKLGGRFQGISVPGSGQGSLAASICSSAEATPHQPPVVPRRESSSSKEAQRTHAVASFLVGLSRARRLSKAPSNFGRKPARDQSTVEDVDEDLTKKTFNQGRQRLVKNQPSTTGSHDIIQTPARALTKQDVIPDKQAADASSQENVLLSRRASSNTLEKEDDPLSLHLSLTPSIASPLIPEPSSIYSPGDVSPSKSRSPVSPTLYKSQEVDRDVSRDSQTTTHLSWHGHRPMTAVGIGSGDSRHIQQGIQDDTTTDLRLSAYRYPQHYLPDLKEESHEDSSLNTSASNLKHSSFRFSSGGLPAIRASADDALPLGHNASFQRSSLSHSHGLPSMHFSQMNLIEKLNEALDKQRSSRSLDGGVGGRNDAGLSGLRPSAAEMRDKYRSFFASLDDLHKEEDITQAATIMSLMPLEGPYSPEAVLEEIDKLEIPSVSPLTQRLSELLPSLREYYRTGEAGSLIKEEVIMEYALEEINEVGGPVPKRSSARLRPMPGSPNMVVVDDTLYQELTGKEKENVGMVGGGGVGEGCGRTLGENGHGKGRSKSVGNACAREAEQVAELDAPTPAVLRTRSLSLGHNELRPSLDSKASSRRSLRSLVSTPTTTTDTRPWNSDKHYPWATAVPSIDISLPTPAAAKQSPRPGPSHLRNRVSETSSSNSGTFGPDTPSAPDSDLGPQIAGHPFTHQRQQSRHLSIFTNKRRNPASPGFDSNGYPTGPLHLRTGDRSHGGERYPTSALTPPTTLHLLEPHQSHFSEDSSEEDVPTTSRRSKFSLKSRFAPSKGTREAHRSDPTSASTQVQGEVGETHDDTEHRRTFNGAQGMPTMAYHKNKFANKIRGWWERTGFPGLFRKMIRRRPYEGGSNASTSSSELENFRNTSRPPMHTTDGSGLWSLRGMSSRSRT
ncbi:hypothetical protein BS50DRAFT_577299 [Corynespora cassiicola Philippines]|uniref:Uncharacterized protein n=1 Tax=Corynespora cassiicola Philippines TaxID=1448308 RepID=A0A2T2NAC4_CORCC|nr:hypothetical protein BS50DRAFT_577299 [Corynespora cassiicola Philippines]